MARPCPACSSEVCRGVQRGGGGALSTHEVLGSVPDASSKNKYTSDPKVKKEKKCRGNKPWVCDRKVAEEAETEQ